MLTGYADRLSYAPGDVATFMVGAGEEPVEVDAQLVRLRRGYAGPSAPRVVDAVVEGVGCRFEARPQVTSIGSCVVAPHTYETPLESLTLRAWIWPTTPAQHGRQGILVHRAGAADAAGLFLEDSGELSLRLQRGGRVEAVRVPQPLRERAWHLVYASFDAATGAATVGHRCLGFWESGAPVEASATLAPGPAVAGGDRWVLGAADAGPADRPRPSGCFNGKLEAPAAWPVAVADFDRAGGDGDDVAVGAAPVVAWDFGRDFDGAHVHDGGPHAMHGVAVNMPTRAVTGRSWSATADLAGAPHEYAAIHFHADDLADSGWQPSFTWRLPERLPSGVYAARLSGGGEVDHIPFVVLPPRTGTDRRVAVVLPTFTYLAYANARSIGPEASYRPLGWEVEDEPLDRALSRHPEFGPSLYDTHEDGSEVVYSSMRRPLLTLRPSYCYRTFGSARHFGADLFLLEWLERAGVPHDVLTDAELHAGGAQALRPYDVVLTGSHPEYCSAQMLDGLGDHVAEGGHVMYLGGNGFCWVAAVAGGEGQAIEVRRNQEYGLPGRAPVGESRLSATGELGGSWTRRGRPPEALFGIGCGSVGVDRGRPYARTPESYAPEHRWLFEGVEGVTFGDFGLSLGGAAGDELDRVNPWRGTPPQTRVLASASGFSDFYRVLPQDQEGILPDTGGTTNHGVRADVVYVPHPGGGAVFSVGSITWISALPVDDYDNDVARITRNALAHFQARAAKARPAPAA